MSRDNHRRPSLFSLCALKPSVCLIPRAQRPGPKVVTEHLIYT